MDILRAINRRRTPQNQPADPRQEANSAVVVGMTATKFSIADPSDPRMLDVAGFDAAVPSLISQFARGI